MPYVSWRGIALSGRQHRGAGYVRSRQELDAYLMSREIALMDYHERPVPFFTAAPSRNAITHMIEHLAILLEAGVRLPEALVHGARQQSNFYVQKMLCAIADDVEKGIALSTACAVYADYFDPLTLQLIVTGETTGTLGATLARAAEYRALIDKFSASLRSAALMPFITLLFCLMTAGILIISVVPRLATLFASSGKVLPFATRALLYTSTFLSGLGGIAVIILLVMLVLHIVGIITIPLFNTIGRWFMHRAPLIDRAIMARECATLFHALAILHERGVPLPKSLALAAATAHHEAVKQMAHELLYDIERGHTLSIALQKQTVLTLEHGVIAQIATGERTATLDQALHRVAQQYERRVEALTRVATAFAQPAMVIVLGLLVGFFVIALYQPLFSMPGLVG